MLFYLCSGCSVSCQKSGYLSVFDGGQTGNKMSQYATLLAHANRTGARPVLLLQMREDLLLHFPRLRYKKCENDNKLISNLTIKSTLNF